MKSNAAAKPAVPASVTALGRKQVPDDGNETLLPVAPPKTSFLPTGLSRAIVIGSVLFMVTACAVGLLGNRFALIPVTRSENAMAYRLDRLTGSVTFCSSVQCAPIPAKMDKID